MLLKILSIIIIIMAFNQVESLPLVPPSIREVTDRPRLSGVRITPKLQFIESRIELTDEEGAVAERFSIWLPSRDLGEDYILISRAGIIRVETVELVHDLLGSL